MEINYTRQKNKIRIDRIKEPEAVVEVPETIDGFPVVELGAYVLAESDVQELHLPSRLEKIGAYAFYQCEKLQKIFCYSRALDLGTGLFAGAGKVELLDITQFAGEKSCLKEMLSELRQTLRVRIHEIPENADAETTEAAGVSGKTAASGSRDGTAVREARLVFPEYYEESVENTPARILFIETHGCGHRYRYCFVKTQFQYRDYDELFPHIQVQEPEELVTELVLGRLMYPCELTGRAEEMYRKYAAEHWQMAGKLLIGMHRLRPEQATNLEAGRLPWLVEEVLMKYNGDTGVSAGLAEQIRVYIDLAQREGDTESVSWLMDLRQKMCRDMKDDRAVDMAAGEAGDKSAGAAAEKEGNKSAAAADTFRKRRRFEL